MNQAARTTYYQPPEHRNFAVITVRQNEDGTLDVKELPTNDRVYGIIVAAACKAIDMMLSSVGITAILEYAVRVMKDPGLNITSPEIVNLVDTFLSKINLTSPLLVVDSRMRGTPSLMAEHPRAPWDGAPSEFNMRNQPLRINAFWLDCVLAAYAQVELENKTDSPWFLIAFFIIVHAMNHEYWHIL